MNSIERIANAVLAHTRNTRRVFKQPMCESNFAQRPARRKVVTAHGDYSRVYGHKMGLAQHAITAMQTKQIAALRQQRTELKISARKKFNSILQLRFTPRGN